MVTLAVVLLLLFLTSITNAATCQCGWRMKDSAELFTHRIFSDFQQYPDAKSLPDNPNASAFSTRWWINSWSRASKNLSTHSNMQYDPKNVEIRRGTLVLKQSGYTAEDRFMNKSVTVAGVQSKNVDILYGSFRTVMKIEGARNGNAVGAFFWNHVSLY